MLADSGAMTMGFAPTARHFPLRAAAKGSEPTIRCTWEAAFIAVSNGAGSVQV